MGCMPHPGIIKIEKRQPVLIHLSRPYDFNRKATNLSIERSSDRLNGAQREPQKFV